jgi:hypothetical protein
VHLSLITLKRIDVVGDHHAAEANSGLPAGRSVGAPALGTSGHAGVTRRSRQTFMTRSPPFGATSA